MDPESLTFLQWFFRAGAIQGVALVFVTCILGCIIWFTFILAKLAQEWIPKKASASIERDRRVGDSMEAIVELLECVHDNSHDTQEGLQYVVAGASIAVKKNKERLGIGSDVLMCFENAAKALTKKKFVKRRYHKSPFGPPPEQVEERHGDKAS